MYVFEHEFKKTYKNILDKQKLKNSLNQTPNNIDSLQLLSNKNNNNSNYFPKSFLLQKNSLNKLFPYSGKTNLKINYYANNFYSYDFNYNLQTFNILKNYKFLNYNNKFKNIFNINNGKFLYEFDKFEDVEETVKNVRIKNYNFSVKLIKGLLNKHNKFILNNSINLDKNILFNYRLNKSEITQKISQIEQF